MKQNPNILLIVMDAVRADHLSCYGYKRPTTPFLEEMAADGVIFDNAFAAAPWTPPSHASLFTGTYPSKHGVDVDYLVTESQALRCLASQAISSFRLPRVLVEGKFNSHEYLVTETMPANARPIPARWEPIRRRCREELTKSSCRTKPVRELSWWNSFLSVER